MVEYVTVIVIGNENKMLILDCIGTTRRYNQTPFGEVA